jgi:hypothetical protein
MCSVLLFISNNNFQVNLTSLANQKLEIGIGTRLISNGHHLSLMEELRLLPTLLKRRTNIGNIN